MEKIGEKLIQMDLFVDPRTQTSQQRILPANTPLSAPAPVFVLHEQRAVRESQDERRLTRKVLDLLEL